MDDLSPFRREQPHGDERVPAARRRVPDAEDRGIVLSEARPERRADLAGRHVLGRAERSSSWRRGEHVMPSFLELIRSGSTYEHWSRSSPCRASRRARADPGRNGVFDYCLDLLAARVGYLKGREE